MRKVILLPIFLLMSLSLFSQSINWFDSYDKAQNEAKNSGKNILILITAPSWCIWCQRLEQNVLSKPEFKKYVSENYVAVKLLDKVNGKANPELQNFDFSGYPTVFLYDSQGGFIGNIYTQDPKQMLASLSRYKTAHGKKRPRLNDLILPDKYTFTADGGGEYVNNGDGTWTLISGGEKTLYDQTRYDFDYLYIQSKTGSHVIALPMKGTDRHMANLVDGKWVWSDLPDVKRVGGDPYFN